jgi:hypothetical protein
MTPGDQERADAANDSYINRSQSDMAKQTEVTLGDQKYQVFGYANDPISGVHPAPPPNTLIAMRLGDYGGKKHFDSTSPDNLLAPDRFRAAAQRYADNKAAFDPLADRLLAA